MKWIDSTDIRSWADRRDCQETLPLLVRKLIRATSNSIQTIKFPSGENVLLSGWDGILEVTERTEFLPLGTSLWEFGTNKNIKEKADKEYIKRTNNPLGFNPSESTFIFVTPRLWQNSIDWVNEKMKDSIWKEIRVINSVSLEEWIEIAPTVGNWLAKQIGRCPERGVQSSDDFWEEWATGERYKLIPEVLLGGRKHEQLKIYDLLKQPSIISVQGISREESLAFIISCFKDNPDMEEDFFSRSIIVDNIEAFRELSVQNKPLILIPRFEDNSTINRAVQKGHSVIVPLGADSSNNWHLKVVLPQIDRNTFVSALIKIGIAKEFAERYSKETARNITILRRQLEFSRTLPEWARPENVRDIIPALLVGRWDENYENDQRIISQIANEDYQNYSIKLNRWLYSQDSPIVKIGSTWRLTSPFDAWTNASKNLIPNDFNLLYKFALQILSEINPAFQLLPEQRYMSSIYGKNREFSGWIREGIIQSLILTAILGDNLKFNLSTNAQLWVDSIITELLSSDNPLLWKSFENKLPLIAEASPASFLNSIERHLANNKSPIISLFDEDPGILTGHSYHTGLLWALESLAWFPEYLSRSALILANLSSRDPGGSLSNRPINSLVEIFKPWHYQTLAPIEERLEVIRLICKKESKIAWILLVQMLPEPTGGVALGTNKTRWRMFDMETEKPVLYKEIFETHSAVIDLLISIFDYSEIELSKLIEVSVNILPHDRKKVLSFIETVLPKIRQTDFTSWHTVRKILHHHHSYPETNWALPESELSKYDELYKALMPTNELEKIIWMFNDHWPKFPEGHNHKKISWDQQDIIIREKRIDGLRILFKEFGLEKISQLSKLVKEKWILGDTLSYIIEDEKNIISICESLNNDIIDIPFFHGFIFRRSLLSEGDWIFVLFKKLVGLGFKNSTLAQILLPLNQTQSLWNFIQSTNAEICSLYWKNMVPRFYNITIDEKIYGLNKLIEYKRFLSAVSICSHSADKIPSEIIINLLEKTGIENSEENLRLDGYEINQLFENLDNRNDFDNNILIRLEWLYMPLLAAYGNSRTPKRLHEELARNPEFFIDVLKWIYKPDDESIIEAHFEDLTQEQITIRSRQAFELLHSWKKIPGVGENWQIDYQFLNDWIKKARNLAKDCGRIEVADVYIGQVLSQFPEDQCKLWPPNEICSIIETLNSDSINNNFSVGIFNKNGSSIRGPFDGGIIERGKADYFLKLAQAHRNKFPTLTKIFENLAKTYLRDAKRMDEQAERDRLEY